MAFFYFDNKNLTTPRIIKEETVYPGWHLAQITIPRRFYVPN